MAEVGQALLALAVVSTLVAIVGSIACMITGLSWLGRVGAAGLWAAAATSAAATLILARAFAVADYSLVAVADHSREALGTWDRIMGLWGGMAGSLLLFGAATAVFAAVGLARRPHPVAVAAAGVVVGTLLTVGRVFADPFATLQIPALDGVGLTPILEHWAMRIHPPLVYAGMTVLIVPTARTLAALADRRIDDAWWREVRPWLLSSWALLGFGMLLGAHWAHAELGWGGYWAWDPVENAALMPWLAVTIALHAGSGHRSRLAAPATLAPLLLALLGATLTRSGATSSVHAFAEARDIGRALLVLLVMLVAVATALVVRATRTVARRVPGGGLVALSSCAVVAAVLGIVMLGTLYPVLRGWFGGDRLAIQGHFFSSFVGPLAVLGLIALIARGHWPSLPSSLAAGATALVLVTLGWRQPFPVALAALAVAALVASIEALVRTRRVAELAHVGLALMLLGIAGTATGAHLTTSVPVGESIAVDGHRVELLDVGIEPGPTTQSTAVVAALLVDGHERTAVLVAYPDRDVVLPETTSRSTPLVDVQVVLRDASDAGALLVVNVAPLQQLVWWGAGLMVAGGVAGALPSLQPSSGRGRRRRWASSSDPSVELEGSAGGAAPDGGALGSPAG